jgi:hypothetical protein
MFHIWYGREEIPRGTLERFSGEIPSSWLKKQVHCTFLGIDAPQVWEKDGRHCTALGITPQVPW